MPEWQRLLPGVWRINMATADGLQVEAKIVYDADGSFRWQGTWQRDNQPETMTVTGNWRVAKGYLYYQATTSTNPKRIAVGFKWADKLVEIDAEHFVFFSINDQKVTARR